MLAASEAGFSIQDLHRQDSTADLEAALKRFAAAHQHTSDSPEANEQLLGSPQLGQVPDRSTLLL